LTLSIRIEMAPWVRREVEASIKAALIVDTIVRDARWLGVPADEELTVALYLELLEALIPEEPPRAELTPENVEVALSAGRMVADVGFGHAAVPGGS
jgi:hypothetical protein